MSKEKTEINKTTYLRLYAGINEAFDVVVSLEKKHVGELLEEYGIRYGRGNVATAWFHISIDEKVPEKFCCMRDGELPFDFTAAHWDRLYSEIYYFLTGTPEFKHLKPKKKKYPH